MILRHHSHCRVLLAALLLAMSLMPGNVALAQDPYVNDWSVVRETGFSPNRAANISLDLSSQDVPYVAYIDYPLEGEAPNQSVGTPRVTVQRYYGTGWETVGERGFSDALGGGPIREVRLALDSHNVPYVAYRSTDLDNARLNVARFKDGTWTRVGNADGTEFPKVTGINLVIDPTNDVPYLAFTDVTNEAPTPAVVMKLVNDTTWTRLGQTGPSDGSATDISIAIRTLDTPYVVYSDGSRGGKATVMRFANGDWEPAGTAESPGTGISECGVAYTSIDLDSQNAPYVAYQDLCAGSTMATVRRLGTSGWETVGTERFTAGVASFLNIAINRVDNADVPYLAYKDGAFNGKASVYYYDSLGYYRLWRPIGTQSANPAVSDNKAGFVSMTLDRFGSPWVAYPDGTFTPERATVKRYKMPDMKPPLITLIPDKVGWYNKPVTVNVFADNPTLSPYRILNLTCIDSDKIETPIVSLDSPNGATSLQSQFSLNEGLHSIECWTTNDAGFIGRAGDSAPRMPASYNVDMTPPTITNPVVNPNPVKAGSSAIASAVATDNLDKTITATCDPVNTSQIGVFTVECRATDLAGNQATPVTATYEVIEADPLPTDPPPTDPPPTTTPPPGGQRAFVYLPLLKR